MKLALIGYGKMGKMVEEASLIRGHQVVAIIDPTDPKATANVISTDTLRGAEVCIDFTQPDAVLNNARLVAASGCALVIGTTGWLHQKEAIQEIVISAGIGALYGANFSIGVHLFLAIAHHAAMLLNKFPDYDVGGIELHHRQKSDSPSGTARLLAEQTLEELKRKKTILYNAPDRALDPTEMQFSSVRCGSIPGTHALLFDSLHDTIEIQHTARSRKGFAEGAVEAAEWIRDRVGFYSIEEMMQARLSPQDPLLQ